MPGPSRPQAGGRGLRPGRAGLSQAAEKLRERLITPAEAEAIEVRGGSTDAAVLVPLYDWPEGPGLIFTERRGDLRRHAGEISFPGGRRDGPGEELVETALREAEEEVALPRSEVELAGALPPVGTFVTGYKVFPFVGLVPAEIELHPNPDEVAEVLRLRIDDLVAGHAKRRLTLRGMPVKTDTYVVGDHLIWGATARIVALLLERIT